MDQVTSIHLAHLPPDNITHILLVRNLKNAPFLLEQLVAGNTDYEYALLDATTVCSSSKAGNPISKLMIQGTFDNTSARRHLQSSQRHEGQSHEITQPTFRDRPFSESQ